MPSTPAGYTLPPIYRATPGTTIRAEQHNIPFEDVAQGINDSIARDGTRPPTANFPMNSRKITGLGTGTANGDAVNLGQVNNLVGAASASASAVNTRVDNLVSALTTAMNSACPLGMVAWHNGLRANIPNGWVAADGQSVDRTQMPALWEWIGNQSPITETAWQASPNARVKYSTGNGTTTFRFPDLNGIQTGSLKGLFLRGSAGGTLQNAQGDTIRNIEGSFVANDNIGTDTGAFFQDGSVAGTTGTGGTLDILHRFDASRVVPTSTENRPVSAVGVWIVRAYVFNFSGI